MQDVVRCTIFYVQYYRVSTHMTNNSYGNKKSVDTSRFRRAIWNHVQVLTLNTVHSAYIWNNVHTSGTMCIY